MTFHWRNLSVVQGLFLHSARFFHLGLALLLGATLAVPASAIEVSASLVRDIWEGSSNSLPEYLEDVNGTLFFVANDGPTGRELWKSDGTEGGTVLVKDIKPGGAFDHSNPRQLTNVNGTLFFVADDGISGRELWTSDGTEAGTVVVKDIRPGEVNSNPMNLTAVGDTLYFTATHVDYARELWKSDGTEEGTVLVKDINPGGSFNTSEPDQLTDVDGTLFFQANDGVNGVELWKSDGTESGTVMVKNIRNAHLSSNPNWLTNVNGTLFFAAEGDSGIATELWKSDGTEQGTVLVKDIHETGGSFPVRLQNVNGLLMFSATDGDEFHGRELWASDGTETGTYLVKDINPEGSSQPTLYGNLLSVFHMSNVAAGDRLFFRAYDGTTDTSLSSSGELWVSDGTEEGTFQVKDIYPDGESQPSWITAIGNNVFFKAEDGVHHNDLFFSDGTEEGTFLVDEFRTDGGASVPRWLTNVNGILMLSASDGNISSDPQGHGRELWKVELITGNLPPAIEAIDDQSVTVGEQIVVEPAVSDPEDDPFTLTWEGVPDGAVVNGFFSWTPQAGDDGDYEITVSATQDDNPDLSDSETFVITVLASDNQPPVIEAIISPSVFVGEELVVEPVVSDPEDDPFTLTWEGVPDGAVVNGFFSWTPQPGDEGDYIVTVTATQDDNPDLFDSESFVVSVLAAPDNQPPEIDAIDDQSILAGEQIVVQPVVSDPEDDPFTLTWDGVPEGAVVNAFFSWTPEADDVGDYLVTVTATQDDNPDLSNSESFVISVLQPQGLEVPEVFDIRGSEPTIDGILDVGEWLAGARLETENGFLAFMHDQERLYVLIDVLDDNGDDPIALGGGDQFWLHFDVNEDDVITPGVDLRFRLEAGTGNLRYQTYCDDCPSGFHPLVESTLSSRGEGFGCFFDDGSMSFGNSFPFDGEPTCNEHRVWELAIDLGEIGMRNGSTRFGYEAVSGEPVLSESFPPDLSNMNHYSELTLEGDARLLATDGPGSMDPEFEVTQAIQTIGNELDLAAGKPTAVRVWDAINESPVRTFIHGTRNGVELSGSPLLEVGGLSRMDSFGGPRNSTGFDNSFQRLPESWTEDGTVDISILVQGMDDIAVANLQDSIYFAPTEVPVFWIVPVRNALANGEVLQSTATSIVRRERLLRTMVPIREIEIARRPILDVVNITTSEDLKVELRAYDQQVVLAWTSGLPEAAFSLPDQITGFHDGALGFAGGSSDPIWWNDGNARITWAYTLEDGESTYIHELNHNLDTDSSGTWGRHSTGCGAGSPGAGPDSSWPYGTSHTIQEVGVLWAGLNSWSISGFVSFADSKPDLMSYCRSNSATLGAHRWMSPYRWEAWLDLFRTDLAESAEAVSSIPASTQSAAKTSTLSSTTVEDSFYIMGRVFPDGNGRLGQILHQPGLPTAGDSAHQTRVQVLDCSDDALVTDGFTPSFIDVEGNPVEFVSFDFIIPAPSESCAIELVRDGTVVDRRERSAHAPEVTLLVPNGGESWDGIETVSWSATDTDGDALGFTLQYSPDGGLTWLPVATGITDNSYEVDTTGLPGSTDARMRILATDGFHTSADQSDDSFTVAVKPPTVEIYSPADNGLYPAGQPLYLDGAARNTFGTRLPATDLIWAVDGEPVGQGNPIRVNLPAGDHVITLAVPGEDDELAMTSVAITVADLGPTEDPADTAFPGVDLASAEAFIGGDRLHCEMEVRSGESGLTKGSRFACHIDFDNLELEGLSECDADGNGVLDGEYRLGSNGPCSTSDIAITYRHDRRGGTCTGGPGTDCSTREFSADGSSDGDCDGDVDGAPASTCKILVSGLLSTIGDERDLLCTDAPEDCLGGVNGLTDDYRAYLFFEAHYRHFKDWAPDTDDGGSPNSPEEVLQIPLVR